MFRADSGPNNPRTFDTSSFTLCILVFVVWPVLIKIRNHSSLDKNSSSGTFLVQNLVLGVNLISYFSLAPEVSQK